MSQFNVFFEKYHSTEERSLLVIHWEHRSKGIQYWETSITNLFEKSKSKTIVIYLTSPKLSTSVLQFPRKLTEDFPAEHHLLNFTSALREHSTTRSQFSNKILVEVDPADTTTI
ncbi:hypothetical protein WA1_12755 [Scytonema hofmannii PCC 7110]|uniref:Uncharacterized protein n=1 Tax=Scytonema hofmannii PCC 7110 TaxID=128403 RepID=A0A139XE43_9CYAN|nr:hypothetical protein WA1_12755 [Scytonema hofmannii PCC 7110]